MRIGSTFTGVGALDLAVERVLGGRTVWQVEQAPAARRVLARHWPDADRSCTDVREARGLAPVDVVIGGFPCQDLSVAGKRAGLQGARSGLFYELARVVAEQRPSLVVMENVPGVLKYRDIIEAALPGYGFRWVRWSATTAGAPHLRRRVLIVATRGGPPLPDLDLTVNPKAWAAQVADGRPWPTPLTAHWVQSHGGRGNPSLAGAVRMENERLWPTPSVKGNHNRAGASPASGDGLATAAEACWASPQAALARRSGGRRPGRCVSHNCLGEQARTWPTPMASDAKEARRHGGQGGTVALCKRVRETGPGRLAADWVETLMGWPVGWTRRDGPSLRDQADALLDDPRWPRGRPPADHVGPWPGYEWEPDRTRSGPPVRGRPARLKACGNGVVPQAAALALEAALHNRPNQPTLFPAPTQESTP